MTPRPTSLLVRVEGIPESLRAEQRWVLWRYVLRDGRRTKVPYMPSGRPAKANDPSTFCSFTNALAAYKTGRFDGLGFGLGAGWAGVDLDKCAHGEFTLVDALDHLFACRPAYVETSPTGTGYKAIGRSSRIGGEISFKTDPPTFTTWQGARFFAITGHGEGDPSVDITSLIDNWFPPAPLIQSSHREGYAHAAEMSDEMLWALLLGADDERSDAILALYRGDTSAYGGDHSRADLALCCHLAFWTNYDAERVDRMFRQSKLCRPKWDRASYRRATLRKALEPALLTAPLPGIGGIRGL